jgi:hypothetical protein
VLFGSISLLIFSVILIKRQRGIKNETLDSSLFVKIFKDLNDFSNEGYQVKPEDVRGR